MSYSTNGLSCISNDANVRLWLYKSADDDATVNGASYFSDGVARGMQVGDPVIVIDTATPEASLCVVASVTSTAATTAFGAVA